MPIASADLTSTAACDFAKGFLEVEVYRLPKPGCIQFSSVRVQGPRETKNTVVFAVIPKTDPGAFVQIELAEGNPFNRRGNGVDSFRCVCKERPATGIVDFTTGEVVLGFDSAPI